MECVTKDEANNCGHHVVERRGAGLWHGQIPRPSRRHDDKATGAVKHDAGKAPIDRGLLSYFPRALEAVAFVSQFGYEKYKQWGGWRFVPDGLARYSDAALRHRLLEKLNDYDAESGYLHAAHEAWNALARLEKMLEDGKVLRQNSS